MPKSAKTCSFSLFSQWEGMEGMAPNARQGYPVGSTIWPPRRQISEQEKAYKCDFPGCNLAYNIKCNLLRHQTTKHGRKKIDRKVQIPSANDWAAEMAHLKFRGQRISDQSSGRSERDRNFTSVNLDRESYESTVSEVSALYDINVSMQNQKDGGEDSVEKADSEEVPVGKQEDFSDDEYVGLISQNGQEDDCQ